MKKGYLHVAFVIDESGSMGIIRESVISNFNDLISGFDKANTTITVVKFNTEVIPLINYSSIAHAPKLSFKNYIPDNSTALFDAVGYTINSLGETLSAMNEDERPEHILFVIVTDGEENASNKFCKNEIKQMITHQKGKYSWDFMFIGADIDAFKEGTSIGIDVTIQVDRTQVGMKQVKKCVQNRTNLILKKNKN